MIVDSLQARIPTDDRLFGKKSVDKVIRSGRRLINRAGGSSDHLRLLVPRLLDDHR